MTMRGHLHRVILIVAVLLLGACDYGLGTRGGLVDNSTTAQDLVIEVVGAPEPHRGEVAAQSSGQWDAPPGECLGTGVALFTPVGELLTTLDERICDGETLVITDDHLAP